MYNIYEQKQYIYFDGELICDARASTELGFFEVWEFQNMERILDGHQLYSLCGITIFYQIPNVDQILHSLLDEKNKINSLKIL